MKSAQTVKSRHDDLAKLARILRERDYRLAENSLHHFVRASWSIIEPVPFQDNWHIPLIARHLEAVLNHALDLPGEQIQHLIITLPFGSSKTTLTSICFPCWTWCRYPATRFITVSNSQDQMTESAVKSRDILESPWYKMGWPDVRLSTDQNVKTSYKNTATGFRMAFGTRSKGTGRHGDILVFDDFHDADNMFNPEQLRIDIQKYDTKWSSRRNDPNRSCIVIINQRLSLDDLVGVLMERESKNWTVLNIPFTYRGDGKAAGDPRTAPGELYWPARYGPDWYRKEKERGTPYVMAQLEQQPVDISGGLIKLDWFRRYKGFPRADKYHQIVQFWDTASKGDEMVNCPWVCGTFYRKGGELWLVDVHREWHTYPEGKAIASALINRWLPTVVVIEDKSTGQSLLQELPSEHPGVAFLPFEPEGDKITRFGTEAAQVEAGKVWLPERAEWLPDFEGEIKRVPGAEYMDQADMLSMALRWHREHPVVVGGIPEPPNTEGWPDE